MKHSYSVLILFLVLACSTAHQKSESITHLATQPEEKLEIIDVHTHTVFQGMKIPYESGMPLMSEAEYFREFKEAGVVGAVSHTLQGEAAYIDLREQNVIHCAGVGPTYHFKSIENGLKSGKYACIKIYLGYVPRYAYDASYLPLYRLAQKYDIPVVFHTGDVIEKTAMLKFADPLTIDEVAVRFPKVRFVIAHCGNPWIESAAEVAYKNDNVFLDGSAFLIGDISKVKPETIQKSIVTPLSWVFNYVDNPKKLMFGTDWPLTRIASYVTPFKLAIPKEYWKDVFHDNALAVFTHLKPRPEGKK